MTQPSAIGPDAIRATERGIRPRIRRTPVIDVDGAPFGLARPVNLKLELLRHSGSFKARGAFAHLAGRPVPAAGVAAASGGNHGAALAYAARQWGVPARIFVPEITGPAKLARIRGYGAETVVEGARYADALACCEAFVARTGALAVHAYDQPETLLGQGTTALEWEEQAGDLDTVLIAVGGGGLIGGMAAWYRGRVKVIAVEPETAPTLHRALAAGAPVDVEVSGIAADSLGARRVGQLMFPIARDHVAASLLVSDAAIREAQQWLWRELRIAAEPGGAAALAALLDRRYRPAASERIGVLVCGGNVDPATLAS